MNISQQGIDLIKSYEGCKLKAYKIGTDKVTIGYGNTFYPDGRPVKLGDTITQEQGENMLRIIIKAFQNDVNSLLKTPVKQQQFDALVSFAYNVGSDIDSDSKAEGLGDSTLLKKVNANPNDPTIRNEFMKWISKGTIFEKSKIPLATWMGAIFLLSGHKKGISSCQLARDLQIGQKAAWFLLHRIREMVTEKQPELLQDIVSVDETWVGGKWANMRKSKRTQVQESGTTNKIPVMGLMERNGKARLTVIGKDSLKEKVRNNVATTAIVVTDEHLGYQGLNKEYNAHVTVNHSQLVFVQDGFSTNNVEGMFSQLKRMVIGIYHVISPAHLQRYCDEASYRFNTRKVKDYERFADAMKKTKGRLKYKDLVQPKQDNYNGFEFRNT